jgi:hypothetical protein
MPAERQLPTSIGRYRIIRLLGEGGMGAVYEAEQDQPRRHVALKVIKAAWASPELQPASNATFQTNNFPLQGQVATQSPLQSATLTVTNSAGTKSSNMLGTLVQQAGGPYGVTSVFDELAQGSNTVSVTAANCHGSTNNSVTVNYQPIAQGTRFKLIGMEVVQATQDLQNTGTPGRWQTLHGAPLPRRHSSLPALHRRAHRGCLHRPCSD